jgi:CheY-like chemotaxis protein
MDIGLPKMSGYDVARQIRQENATPIILVAVTGWGQEDHRRRSKEAGFDFHLTKPIALNELEPLLQQLQAGNPPD